MKLRAVMDTNVLVSGVLWRGVPFHLLTWAEENSLIIYDKQLTSSSELFAKIESLCTVVHVNQVVSSR